MPASFCSHILSTRTMCFSRRVIGLLGIGGDTQTDISYSPMLKRNEWVLTDAQYRSNTTHDYSQVMTPDYCSFQSGPLSGSALKIKHHHCHKIACSWNLVNLIMGQRVMSTDPWPMWPTQICWPTWPVTRWPIVISGLTRGSYAVFE